MFTLLPAIEYFIQIQRRTKFAMFFYIMPGILINVCAVMVFSLPSESGEKIGLGINSLIAMIVFLMAMTEKIPPTSRLPLAGIYYGVCLAVITANIVFSVFILNMNFKGLRGFEVPLRIRLVAIYAARKLAVQIPELILDQWHLDGEDDDNDSDDEEIARMRSGVTKVKPADPEKTLFISTVNKVFVESAGNTPAFKSSTVETLKDPFQRRTCQALEKMVKIMQKTENARLRAKKASIMEEEWKFVARVMDRFLFIIFFMIAFLFNVIILTSSPFSVLFEYCPFGPNDTRCEGLSESERWQLWNHNMEEKESVMAMVTAMTVSVLLGLVEELETQKAVMMEEFRSRLQKTEVFSCQVAWKDVLRVEEVVMEMLVLEVMMVVEVVLVGEVMIVVEVVLVGE
ncbi:Neurotransmitter-gated ion-channel transmembrane domain, partial [Trinorchestia longiramus]